MNTAITEKALLKLQKRKIVSRLQPVDAAGIADACLRGRTGRRSCLSHEGYMPHDLGVLEGPDLTGMRNFESIIQMAIGWTLFRPMMC